MTKFTSEMVSDYANKLLIGLTPEEDAMVLTEFETIDRNIDLINKIPNIEKVKPMTHALDDFTCQLRDDKAIESAEIKEILQNTKEVEGREIKIPKVVK